MPAEARVTKTWVQQKGLIPVFLIACSLWFLWDGLVGYPRSNERWTAHEKWKQYEQRKDKPEEWAAFCKTQGWDPAPPEPWDKVRRERGWKAEAPEHFFDREKIVGQYVFTGLTGVIGIFSLLYWQRVRRSVLRSDEGAVFTPSGVRVPYESITEVDERRWKSKGLATVFYSLDGSKGRFVLDDAKYSPEALDIILADIHERTAGRAKVSQ